MLTELRIQNFAIISSLELDLVPGLVAFTGETGAGKSIILDALESVLGGRADPTSIRSGAERASVEAVFRLNEATRPAVEEILTREDLLDDPDYLTLSRELRREGRTSARVNGRSVSLPLMREIGSQLVDIHGQSEHLSLLTVRHHIGLLDRYAASEPLLDAYGEIYRQVLAVRRELEETRRAEQETAGRVDLLTFQVQEITSAHLQAGEEETLLQERTRLSNAENLAALAQGTLAALEEGSPEMPSVSDLLGQAVQNLASLSRIDESKASLHAQAESARETLAEVSRELGDYLEQVEFNPRRLEQVEERLELLANLKRKYGGSIQAAIEYAARAQEQLESVTHAGERIAELQARELVLLEELGSRAAALTEHRRGAAGRLARSVEGELNDLHMPGARFAVDFQTSPDPQGLPGPDGARLAFDATGADRVEFLIAPNPGEGLNPLVKTASGGETSRLMLALKNTLARADFVPTLVFDEIDQGIGGRVGAIVGQKLASLAEQHQVLCITHLAQLAAYAGQHLRVAKQVDDGRTITVVEELQGQERLHELAQMLGGVTEGTLRSASEMLAVVKSRRS